MLTLTLYKANFDELNIHNLSKRAVLDSLFKFWNDDSLSYFSYLESLGINYHQSFPNIFSLNQSLNEEIKKLHQATANNNTGKFSFKAVNLLKPKNLRELNDLEYYKLNFDLRALNDKNTRIKIKDIFLDIKSLSLVDFKECEEERLSLIYHKKGAMIFFENYLLNNSRDKINLLENFKEPKDNNFITARFILDFAKRLKEEGIEESFAYSYEIGSTKKEIIKSLDEIIFWGELNPKQKEEQKEKERLKEQGLEEAKTLAKEELKNEVNEKRSSSPQDSNEKIIQQSKPFNLKHNQSLEDKQNSKDLNTQENIEELIKQSFELFHQKELEKTKLRLEKAQKDSLNAYADLKELLNSGINILEAFKNLQQKYRNDETIGFASLLFSKDILSLKAKENEIKTLNDELKEAYIDQDKLNEEITKREESISKLKGTVQNKINEMIQLELDYKEELESLREVELKFKELELYSKEQDETIKELDSENDALSQKNKNLSEANIKLLTQNEALQSQMKGLEEKIKEVEAKEQKNEELYKKSYKLELELENAKIKEDELLKELEILKNENKEFQSLKAKAELFEQREVELKTKINTLEQRAEKLLEQVLEKPNHNDNKENKNLRSRDILGDV